MLTQPPEQNLQTLNSQTMTTSSKQSKLTAVDNLILFDGVCGLCNKFVHFVLERDSSARFHFASLQSDLAKEILGRHGKDPAVLKSIYLIRHPGKPDEEIFSKSAAALRVLGELDGGWSGMKAFLAVPAPLRDVGYDIVAAVRYQIFGKTDACPMPKASDRERFLDI